MEKDNAKRTVAALVESFNRDLDVIKRGDSSLEANVEDNYVKPLFASLGWNIHNTGLSHTREEFIVQYQLKTARGGNVGRPDYLLRVWDESISRMRHVLIMEAKHPKYDLTHEARWISQAYLYAYSTLSRAERPERRVPLSLLTDFEEFRLFDCRDPSPLKTRDDAAPFNKRVIKGFDIRYTDYVDRFDDLWDTFGRDNVAKGSLDQWRITDKELKDARIPPDIAFLDTLRDWRLELARSMYHNDKSLTEDILTAASQLYVNRIVFLKMLADKGLEEGYLTQLLARVSTVKDEGISFQGACADIFDSLDKLYNGSVFAHRLELDSVKVDNKVLKGILESIRPEKAIYSLDAMPVNVVGTMYEEFLGEVIRKAGRGIGAEEKPEVRKAGGVYYTPQYIVDYIVDQTLGKLLEKCKSPEDVIKLHVCDPACGSGSFLLGAYDRLLSWHLDWYKEKIDAALKKGQDFPSIQKKYRDAVHLEPIDLEKQNYNLTLTIKLRRDLLTNCIYGVDIDEQAVEVTCFSLNMKAVEGFYDRDELYSDVGLFNTTILPELKNNIKCGNSLVGEDYFKNKSFDQDAYIAEKKIIKPFDWAKKFPNIFTRGGFDAVIGNPPYVLLQDENRDNGILSYYKNNYKCASYKLDTYHFFMEKGISIISPNGWFGYITPSNYLTNNGLTKLRDLILEQTNISILCIIEGKVFKQASVDTTITILSKHRDIVSHITTAFWDSDTLTMTSDSSFAQEAFLSNHKHIFTSIQNDKNKNQITLGNFYNVNFGMQLRDRKTYISDVITIEQKDLVTEKHVPCYTGRNINRYLVEYTGLLCYASTVAKRGGCWDQTIHQKKPKILVRQIGKTPICGLDMDGYHCLNTLFMITAKENAPLSIHALLGLLNSKMIQKYWLDHYYDKRGTFPKIKGTYLEMLPLPLVIKPDLSLRLDDNTHNIINLLQKAQIARTESDKCLYTSMAEKLDKEIDQLVYELYELTPQEIAMVEEATT
jgi:type I restriction-modification system DNA methylase subunit